MNFSAYISRRSSRALKWMIELANSHPGEPVKIQSSAAVLDVSVSWLEGMAVCLKNKGLIKSKLGPGGGYELALSPDEITLLDIVAVAEKWPSPFPAMDSAIVRACADGLRQVKLSDVMAGKAMKRRNGIDIERTTGTNAATPIDKRQMQIPAHLLVPGNAVNSVFAMGGKIDLQ